MKKSVTIDLTREEVIEAISSVALTNKTLDVAKDAHGSPSVSGEYCVTGYLSAQQLTAAVREFAVKDHANRNLLGGSSVEIKLDGSAVVRYNLANNPQELE